MNPAVRSDRARDVEEVLMREAHPISPFHGVASRCLDASKFKLHILDIALLWQNLSGAGFPNQIFNDSC